MAIKLQFQLEWIRQQVTLKCELEALAKGVQSHYPMLSSSSGISLTQSLESLWTPLVSSNGHTLGPLDSQVLGQSDQSNSKSPQTTLLTVPCNDVNCLFCLFCLDTPQAIKVSLVLLGMDAPSRWCHELQNQGDLRWWEHWASGRHITQPELTHNSTYRLSPVRRSRRL